MVKNFFRVDIKNRVFGLDILRCFAILFVVAGHANQLLPEKAALFFDSFVLDGVSIFFVLSGFLIGGILIKLLEKNNPSIRLVFDFWKRRWFRTLPNYFLILGILCLLRYVFEDHFSLWKVHRYFLFSQNLFTVHPIFFSEAWSLCIEEWFYLIVPLLLLATIVVFKPKTRNALLFIVFLLIISVTCFRYYRYLTVSIQSVADWDNLFRKQVSTRLDSLMYGVFGAYLAYYQNELWMRYKNPLFVIGIVLLVVPNLINFTTFDTIYLCVFSFSINALATLFLMPYLSTISSGRGAIYKGITYIALISYSMYLVNLSLVKFWVVDKIQNPGLSDTAFIMIKYLLFWFLTVLLSLLLYKYFEIPTTKLRDKKGK